MKIKIKKRVCEALEEQPVKKRTGKAAREFQKTQKKEEVRKEISKDPIDNVIRSFQSVLPISWGSLLINGNMTTTSIKLLNKINKVKDLDLKKILDFRKKQFPELSDLLQDLSNEEIFKNRDSIQSKLDSLEPLISLQDNVKNLHDYLKVLQASSLMGEDDKKKLSDFVKSVFIALHGNPYIKKFFKQYPKEQLKLTQNALQNKKQEPQSQIDRELEKKASQYSFDVDSEHLKGNLRKVSNSQGEVVGFRDEEGNFYPKDKEKNDSDDATARKTAVRELKALSEDFDDYSEEVRIAKSVAQEINLSFEEEIFNLQVGEKQSFDFDHTITNDVLNDYILMNDDYNDLINLNELDEQQQKELLENIRIFFYAAIQDEPTLVYNSILFRVVEAQRAFNMKAKTPVIDDGYFDRWSKYVFPDMEESLDLANEEGLLEAKIETEDKELDAIEKQLNTLMIIRKKKVAEFSFDKKYDYELRFLEELFPKTTKSLETLETRIDVERAGKRDIKTTFEKYFPPLAKIQKDALIKRDNIEKEIRDLDINTDHVMQIGTDNQEVMDVVSEFEYYDQIIFFLERMFDFFGESISQYIGLKNLKPKDSNEPLYEEDKDLKIREFNFLPFYDEKTKKIIIKKDSPAIRFRPHLKRELRKLYNETKDPNVKYLLMDEKKARKEEEKEEDLRRKQFLKFLPNAIKDLNRVFKKERIEINNRIRKKLEAKMRKTSGKDKEKQVRLYQLHQFTDALLLEFPHRFESDEYEFFFAPHKDIETEVNEIFNDKKTHFDRDDLFENKQKIKIKLKRG